MGEDGSLTDLILAVVGFILSLILLPVQIIVSIGAINIANKLTLEQKVAFSDLSSSYRLFFRFLGSSILAGIIALIGFILLIIPGIILAIRLQFYMYLIVDKNAGAIEALQQSWNMTKGLTGRLFLFGSLLFLIEILGVLALGVGILVAIPVIYLAQAYVYRILADRGMVVEAAPVVPEPVLS
ncbi:MAG TPA: hypothetical protein VGK02_11925 [Candidatus Aquicultor sp.]